MLACSAMGSNVAGVALLGGLGGPARPDHAFEQLHTKLLFFTVPHVASTPCDPNRIRVPTHARCGVSNSRRHKGENCSMLTCTAANPARSPFTGATSNECLRMVRIITIHYG